MREQVRLFLKKKKIFLIIIGLFLILGISYYRLGKRKYTNADFNIPTYISKVDKDNDGIDDATDILNSVKEYVKRKPIYESKYYATGYPTDNYGVCTDIVAFGLLGAGYDLRELVNADIMEHREDYVINSVDKNIDFRRVNNLKVYLEHTAIKLTTNIKKTEEWQAGDIVVFKNHIGVISDKRNRKGIPYVYHHASKKQKSYEEDILKAKNIVGHYRIS